MVRVLALTLVAAGCTELPIHGDPGESWSVEIQVAPDAATGWTEEAPGQLFVQFDDWPADSQALLCGDVEQAIELTGGGLGCGTEQEVVAWIEPALFLTDADGQPIPCGVEAHDLAEEIERPTGAPFAQGVLFEGQRDCDGGTDQLALTVAAP